MEASLEKNSKDMNYKNWKVKLFILNGEGAWDDYGCGILSFLNEANEENNFIKTDYLFIQKTLEENENLTVDETKAIKLKKNSQGKMKDCLLYSKIEKDYVFERQHDFIISWIDRLLEEEIALSFIDQIAANETWKKISSIAQIQPEIPINEEELKLCPKLSPDNLDYIIIQLENNKDKMIKSVLYKHEEIFDDLSSLFNNAENDMNEELMKKLIIFIKSLIYSGENELIEIALNDKYYLTIYGILEYDGAEKLTKKCFFRKFLTEQIVFKKVVDINNANILSKIHLNYRINFLYDCILEPIMDEARPNPFTKIIYYNNCEILDYFLSENLILDRFCQNFLNKFEESLEFLKEFLDIVKTNLQAGVRLLLMEKFEAFGFIDTLVQGLPRIMSSSLAHEKRIKYLILLIDNFSYLMQIKIKPLIDIFYCNTDKEKGKNFIVNLVELLLYEDEGVQIQVTEFIKQLLDIQNEEKQQILTYLYDVLLLELYHAYEKMLESDTFSFFAQQYIEILIFCIQNHHSRIRYYIIKNEIIQHILKGLNLKKKTIIMIIAKFFKAIIISKDEFLIRYLETKNLLKSLMDLYSNQYKKSEMFQSIMLEIISNIYLDDHDVLKKQLEVYPIMLSSIVKNATNHALELKSRQLNIKEYRINTEFFTEKLSDPSKNNNESLVIVKQSVLNLDILNEDDLDIVITQEDNDDLHKNNIFERKKENGFDSKEINKMSEKRNHINNNEDLLQMEQEMTKIKKVKLE